ncbi:ATP-binding protein [Pseudonocardia broussonetiae]|uniref:AAA family ATPase n=1 Tax=Pseudonocardia broussonetiae TaxID=2736640 RepID=A0A6M6JF13_9PSEU|nr:RNA-binding domain-containing protein [Pseudonocardia broussonetiae]QJY45673.1 AAA family ATPase [Pseudonocardia broussonetiae]
MDDGNVTWGGRVRRALAEGESYSVEFKSERSAKLNDRDLVEAVVCLANGAGGLLLLGVEDDGTPTGSRPRHETGRTDPLRVQAYVANTTQPPVSVTVQSVDVDGVEIVALDVPDSPRVTGTTRGTYVRRAVGSDGRPMCIPFHAHEMLAHDIDRGAVDHAAIPVVGARLDDLDPVEFDRVRRLVNEAGARGDRILAGLSDHEILQALGMARDDHVVTVGALLLFGRSSAIRRFVPTHEAAFQVLRGLQVEANEFFVEPLFRLAEAMYARFEARNREQELQWGLLRVPLPDYSQTAFREALANALTHRDYTRRGAVHVQWEDDQLEISSPGGLPAGVTVQNLLVTPPRPRSPLLADAFKRTGLVERTGRGVNRMFAEQLRVGRAAPDFGRTSHEQVVAILPGGPADAALTRWVLEQERESDRPLPLPDLQVLSELVRERRAGTAELSQVLQRTESETRHLLVRMVEQGWVEARGDGKGRSWHLSAAVHRALEEPSGYVRVRGFEPMQQEQMVLSYVTAHGRISRGQAAELCSLAPAQASRLLGRLVGSGKLVRRGERRGSYYEAP